MARLLVLEDLLALHEVCEAHASAVWDASARPLVQKLRGVPHFDKVIDQYEEEVIGGKEFINKVIDMMAEKRVNDMNQAQRDVLSVLDKHGYGAQFHSVVQPKI